MPVYVQSSLRRSSSGSLAMLAAMRWASSRVGRCDLARVDRIEQIKELRRACWRRSMPSRRSHCQQPCTRRDEDCAGKGSELAAQESDLLQENE